MFESRTRLLKLGPTIIKLFESENVLKCKNQLYKITQKHFVRFIIIVRIIYDALQLSYTDIISLLRFFDIIESCMYKSLRIFSSFMMVRGRKDYEVTY